MKKIDIAKILYEICEDDAVYQEDIDLVDSGLLDSYAFIELFVKLEDCGINLQPTRINRNKLRTLKGIEEIVNSYINESK